MSLKEEEISRAFCIFIPNFLGRNICTFARLFMWIKFPAFEKVQLNIKSEEIILLNIRRPILLSLFNVINRIPLETFSHTMHSNSDFWYLTWIEKTSKKERKTLWLYSWKLVQGSVTGKCTVIANLASVLISYVSLFPLLSWFTHLTEVTSQIPEES